MHFSKFFIIFTIFSLLFFALYPQIDIVVSSFFYNNGFYLKNSFLAELFYYGLMWLSLATFVFLVVILIYQLYLKIDFKYLNKKAILFLLAFFIIAPGIVTNTVIKDHSGRDRPKDIIEFGGKMKFRPYYDFNGNCDHNCSFVSGHAAGAFAFLAFALVFRSKKIFYTVFSFAVLMGIVRIVQGGHFLSDVVFAFILNYFLLSIVYYVFYKKDMRIE
jgi:lipid A 4'-phosphatase